MRNFALILFAILTTDFSFAQGDAQAVYKPAARNFTAEVNFNPFSSSPVSINYLRARKFLTDQKALRLGLLLGFKNQQPQDKIDQSSFEINIRPGYEWHFAGTERLSPYLGADIDVAFKTAKYNNNGNQSVYVNSVNGAWDSNGTEHGFFRFGGNILAGVDFYLIKKLYMGVEFGYGFQLTNYSDIVVTTQGGGSTTAAGGTNFQLGPNYNSSLRLGFVF